MASETPKGRGWLWLYGIVWDSALLCLAYTGLVIFLVWRGSIDWRWIESAYIAGGVGVLLLLLGVGVSGFLVLIRLQDIHQQANINTSQLRRILAGQTSTEAVLTQMSENLLLSDAIKEVAFRDKDREMVVDAIRQDMRRENWESALLLIDELDKGFGCMELAQQLRQEMQKLRMLTYQEKLDAAIKHVESLWLIHRYDDAGKEADLLMRTYPSEPRVQKLKEATLEHLRQHKRDLLSRLDKAIRDNDGEQGVELLKLLDSFLTPNEAAALRESAREVFKAKLQQMGVQFSLYVTEKRWQDALKLGKEIMQEFPNSRMAEEVQSKYEALQMRAQEEG